MTESQYTAQVQWEQERCEYCHDEHEKISDGDGLKIGVLSNVLGIKTDRVFWNVQIMNCPMCGRDLTRGTRSLD